MPIYDALYDFRDNINHILVRHEQGATHAAQGYARIAGKTGVCLATLLPSRGFGGYQCSHAYIPVVPL